MDIGFIFTIAVFIILGQVHGVLKKHGQGTPGEIVGDFLKTVQEANQALKIPGTDGKKNGEAMMKAFAQRRFPELTKNFAGKSEQDLYKTTLTAPSDTKTNILEKGTVIAPAQKVPLSSYGQPSLQPDSNAARIVLVLIVLVLFVSVGFALWHYFGFSF